jgi:hypothetical protein
MEKIDRFEIFRILESICGDCTDVQSSLKAESSRETNQQYHEDIQRDIVTLENLKRITIATRNDISKGIIGESLELILLIAANDFKNKLKRIPDNKHRTKEIIRKIKTAHAGIQEIMKV